MSSTAEQVWEIRFGVYCSPEQARELVDRIQLLLCPDPLHASPCPIPWSSAHWSLDDDEAVATAIIKAARTSMGRDLSAADMEIVMAFAKRTASLAAYRKQLSNYLGSRMNQVAPNLAALIGDTVGARLISKAGSLTNLSKYPASTVQILGAEKALFRA